MGHRELARHLIGNAEGRKRKILEQARREASRRVAAARARAEEMERDFQESLERDSARERDLRLGRAQLEAGAVELRAQAALADEILARLRDRLARVPSEARYPSVAERLYLEILPEIPRGNVTVRADANAMESLAPLLADPRIRRASLPEEEMGGVEVSDEEGAIRIRNTLGARLAKARPALLAEIRRSLARAHE